MRVNRRHANSDIMKWVLLIIIALLILILSIPSRAQLVSDMEDESKLYAESKQVNQFFRRFNGEEDEKGNRYYPGDKHYRSTKLRKKYLFILFDENNNGISHAIKKEFAQFPLIKKQIK